MSVIDWVAVGALVAHGFDRQVGRQADHRQPQQNGDDQDRHRHRRRDRLQNTVNRRRIGRGCPKQMLLNQLHACHVVYVPTSASLITLARTQIAQRRRLRTHWRLQNLQELSTSGRWRIAPGGRARAPRNVESCRGELIEETGSTDSWTSRLWKLC